MDGAKIVVYIGQWCKIARKFSSKALLALFRREFRRTCGEEDEEVAGVVRDADLVDDLADDEVHDVASPRPVRRHVHLHSTSSRTI